MGFEYRGNARGASEDEENKAKGEGDRKDQERVRRNVFVQGVRVGFGRVGESEEPVKGGDEELNLARKMISFSGKW